MSKAPFRFPISAGDISLFCHPSPDSGLDRPHYLDGDLHAGNGFIAIRARRGLWMESDFDKAPYEFMERLSNLPWNGFPDSKSPEWRSLDDIRGTIYKYATVSLWNDQGKRQPSPIWRIGGAQYIRLSHLQLIARLPGAKVYAGPLTKTSPIYITYNGGTVLLPLEMGICKGASFDIFAPTFDRFDNTRQKLHTGPRPSFVPPPAPEPAIEDWPPIDTSEL